ncbi:hypothetical protein ACWKWU_22500 [Chitinophaga lutea]
MKKLLFAVCVTLAACSGKNNGPGGGELPFTSIEKASSQAGIGLNEGTPPGTPFTLPAGLKFVTRKGRPFDPDLSKLHGNMNTFYADIHIYNEKPEKDTVEFPPGLTFVDINPSKIQNGILMDRVYFVVNGLDTTTVNIGLGCLNEHFAQPWSDNQDADTKDYPIGKGMYAVGNVTNDPGLLKLISMVKELPKLRVKQHYNPYELFEEDYVEPEWMKVYSVMQEMLWKITDGYGMSEDDILELNRVLKPYR